MFDIGRKGGEGGGVIDLNVLCFYSSDGSGKFSKKIIYMPLY